MDYSLLIETIRYIEEYQQQNASKKIEDFVIWLNNKLFATNGNDAHSAQNGLLIAYKVIYLNKELKKLTKHILSSSKISSIDEYSFLLHLHYQESFRKMEIVELHNLEAPTGIEIINRLLRNKLIEQYPDKEDKRAKRIKITEKGIEEVKSIKPNIDRAFSDFTEPLNLNEKIQISGILEKLIK